MPVSFDLDNLYPIFAQIRPENIVLLKSIIEAYEDLAIIRTLNPQTGEVVILALNDTIGELRQLLDSLKSELDFREIPAPDTLSGDWLLAEFAKGQG